ncbi:hypothetical protein MBEHAL_0687 [Halarchaeum acidiphilum MH1-52-1]|uniref:Uncharacterized protein n=1 Tax=Halarchaeum acidiphilum MH1-52-1 TaxID=1261545 RepID=U2YT62_9EURY|nr:hypothetical protein MBEHAL_0687 [Halarchaeum acidiphilum MH1-52-1]
MIRPILGYGTLLAIGLILTVDGLLQFFYWMSGYGTPRGVLGGWSMVILWFVVTVIGSIALLTSVVGAAYTALLRARRNG